MARVPSSTVIEMEALIGQRGNIVVTSDNRSLIQKWLTASGVPAVTAKQQTLKTLADVYNDTNDAMLNALKGLEPGDPEDAIKYALQTIMVAVNTKPKGEGISPEQLKAAIKSELKDQMARPLEIKIGQQEPKVLPAGLRHKDFSKILKAVTCGNVALIGPAGSGKTTLAEQVSQALGVPFKFTGAISSEYKLTGFIDAHGRVIHTAFREAYEKGGLFLFDEIDGSLPGAVLAFNAALANGHADFPDGSVPRHKDFYCMAAANTYWTGSDRVYVGRNQLDGATLDRFIFVDLSYDETMERALGGNEDWVTYVQDTRRKVKDLKIRHIVSPRASIMGSKLLDAGLSQKDVKDMVLYKGLSQDDIKKIERA